MDRELLSNVICEERTGQLTANPISGLMPGLTRTTSIHISNAEINKYITFIYKFVDNSKRILGLASGIYLDPHRVETTSESCGSADGRSTGTSRFM